MKNFVSHEKTSDDRIRKSQARKAFLRVFLEDTHKKKVIFIFYTRIVKLFVSEESDFQFKLRWWLMI